MNAIGKRDPKSRPPSNAGAAGPMILYTAVAATGWFVWFAFVPLLAGLNFDAANAIISGVLQSARRWGEADSWKMLVSFCALGFLWQGVVWRPGEAWPRRVLFALGVGLALIGGAGLLALLQANVAQGPHPTLSGAISGVVLGMLPWWHASALIVRSGAWLESQVRRRRLLQVLSLAILVFVVLLPIDQPGSVRAVLDPAHPVWSGYSIMSLPNHVYALLKAVILWLPVGFLYAVAQREQTLGRWVAAVLFGVILVGLPWIHGFSLADVGELAALPLGAFLGAWVGVQVRGPSLHAKRGAAAVAAAPNRSSSPPTDCQVNAGRSFPAGVRPLGGAMALVIVGAVLVVAFQYPRFGFILTFGLASYALALLRYPTLWMLVVPAALPLLDLAPWTGRFYLDGFDLVMLVTLVVPLCHGRREGSSGLPARVLMFFLALLAVSWVASMLIGVLPMQPLDLNAFSSYWSHYNSLRVAKGFGWALLIALFFHYSGAQDEKDGHIRLFFTGMCIGLAGVIVIALRERWQFAELFDLAVRYRITATFSAMHTGGGHIEAYLAAALPFLWLFILEGKSKFSTAVSIVLFYLGVYVMIVTISRGGMEALLCGLAVLVAGSLRYLALRKSARVRTGIVLSVVTLSVIAGVVVGTSGAYLQNHLVALKGDWQTRALHWRKALDVRDDNRTTRVLGMGLGSFPITYLYRSLAPTPATTYSFERESDNVYLRLGAGEALYMAQYAPVKPNHRYKLVLDVRSGGERPRVEMPLCEKHLLDFFQCRWAGVSFPSSSTQWQHREVTIDSESLGQGSWFTRRPTDLSLYNPVQDSVIDIDNVKLLDSSGHNLLSNGDFSKGGDYWFARTYNHLPWQIENLYVHMLFEQGWFGLSVFVILVLLVVFRLVGMVWRGSLTATSLLAALVALLIIGIVDSLFDAPRLTALFFAIVVLGLTVENAARTKST